MSEEVLVHSCRVHFSGHDYDVFVYSRPDGSHLAKTFFTPRDVIISDGITLDEVLLKHQHLLPLAVTSRDILRQFRKDN
ncbi:MAG: hypothetical protein AB7F21_10950 [Desulfuromonadales bacterium]|uniref:hypothetical protein n=1 Tax=Desulfuromonas sp. KJ2020 TaxID=2919173 RepID=UPI000320E933|nr:hypothetical protein [Desulfuromonas sp. KJ2020]MCP3178212.1 hypothetical protein [Desulfuromonas sp. KJ2020]